jgi:hypothetical protein
MEFQPALITKTREACLHASADIIPVVSTKIGEAGTGARAANQWSHKGEPCSQGENMLEISNQVDRSGILPQYTGVLGTAHPRGTWSRMTSQYPYIPMTFLELMADIKAWMNIFQDQEAMDKIKTLIPAWAYSKTLMVYWSGLTPMEPNQESAV